MPNCLCSDLIWGGVQIQIVGCEARTSILSTICLSASCWSRWFGSSIFSSFMILVIAILNDGTISTCRQLEAKQDLVAGVVYGTDFFTVNKASTSFILLLPVTR